MLDHTRGFGGTGAGLAGQRHLGGLGGRAVDAAILGILRSSFLRANQFRFCDEGRGAGGRAFQEPTTVH